MNEALITLLIVFAAILLTAGLVFLVVGLFASFTTPVYSLEKCIGPGTKMPDPQPHEPHPADYTPSVKD